MSVHRAITSTAPNIHVSAGWLCGVSQRPTNIHVQFFQAGLPVEFERELFTDQKSGLTSLAEKMCLKVDTSARFGVTPRAHFGVNPRVHFG